MLSAASSNDFFNSFCCGKAFPYQQQPPIYFSERSIYFFLSLKLLSLKPQLDFFLNQLFFICKQHESKYYQNRDVRGFYYSS